jgi:hypothetical protein
LFESDDAFAQQPATATSTRKKKSGTAAEIDLPESSDDYPPTTTNDLGDVIDGTEDDISDLEHETAPLAFDVEGDARDPAVTAAVKAVMQATANKKRIPPMADTAKKTTTKADSIRATIAKMKATGNNAIRPRDVIAALEKQGITVTAPQVSVMLRDWDKQADKPTTSVKTPAKVVRAVKSEKPSKATTPAETEARRVANKVRSIEVTPQAQPQAQSTNGAAHAGLMQTAAFVKSVGGTQVARELLSVFEQLMAAGG